MKIIYWKRLTTNAHNIQNIQIILLNLIYYIWPIILKYYFSIFIKSIFIIIFIMYYLMAYLRY